MQQSYCLVLLFDRRENAVTFLAHDLLKEEAEEEVRRLRSEGLPAFHFSYSDLHRTPETEGCHECEKLWKTFCSKEV